MAFLEQFTDEERDLIVSIPYRAGWWVSAVDDTGGPAADYQELDELESILAEKARGMFESAFVHEVMAECFARQDDWKKWAGDESDVLADCRKAVEIVSGKLTDKDLDAFRGNIMSLALEIAKAFREFDADATFLEKIAINFRLFIKAVARIITRERNDDGERALNISYEEDMALAKLSKALHPELDEMKTDQQISES